MPTYLQIQPSRPVPLIDAAKPYKAVLILDSVYKDNWQADLSRELARSGCLYMMAWGSGCSSWDDSVDMANLEAYNFGDIPEDSFIMTTWHDDEKLEEVFEFANLSAHHPSIVLEDLIIIHVGETDQKEEHLRVYGRP